MKKIFLAFSGFQVKIKGRVKKIGPFEFWNLEKIDQDDFISLIQKKIKPVNRNVRRNYYTTSSRQVYEKAYQEATWGMLLPDYTSNQLYSWAETLFAVNLYTDLILPLLFTVGGMGIFIERPGLSMVEKAQFHSEDRKFTKKKFTQFYKSIAPEVQDIYWNAYQVLRWNREQWRFSIVCLLFEALKKYQNAKQPMTWQKECADMTTFYEALLSRFKGDNGSYKIIQRIEVLLSGNNPREFANTKQDLQFLFNYRNEFVHGQFFDRLKNETRRTSSGQSMAQLPNVDFRFLTDQKEVLRKVLIVYTYLQKKFRNTRNASLRNKFIPEIMNMAIMDTVLRKRIQKYSSEILKLAYRKK